MRVNVSSILDQSSDREVERVSREDLNALRGRCRSLEGEDPMKAEEVTDVRSCSCDEGRCDSLRRFRRVETVWSTGGQELEIHVTFPGPHGRMAVQVNPRIRFLRYMGGLLASFQDRSDNVRHRGACSAGPLRSQVS